MVVEAFERVAAGHTLRQVARDFAARGVVGRRGRPMTAATLRPMLLSDDLRRRARPPPGAKQPLDASAHGDRRAAVEGDVAGARRRASSSPSGTGSPTRRGAPADPAAACICCR